MAKKLQKVFLIGKLIIFQESFRTEGMLFLYLSFINCLGHLTTFPKIYNVIMLLLIVWMV